MMGREGGVFASSSLPQTERRRKGHVNVEWHRVELEKHGAECNPNRFTQCPSLLPSTSWSHGGVEMGGCLGLCQKRSFLCTSVHAWGTRTLPGPPSDQEPRPPPPMGPQSSG